MNSLIRPLREKENSVTRVISSVVSTISSRLTPSTPIWYRMCRLPMLIQSTFSTNCMFPVLGCT